MKNLLVVLVVVLSAVPVMANPSFSDGGQAVQSVLNGITTAPSAGQSSVNAASDYMQNDQYWSITGTGGSVNTIVVELAAYSNYNRFGVYDMADPTKQVTLFLGPADAGAQATLSIKANGAVYVDNLSTGVTFAGNDFGYFIKRTVTDPAIYYSDSTLNANGEDHLAAYQGKNIDTVQVANFVAGLWTNNEYILAWEDTTLGSTGGDYNDFVAMVESVRPVVPAPGAILLAGIGTCLVGWMKKRQAA